MWVGQRDGGWGAIELNLSLVDSLLLAPHPP